MERVTIDGILYDVLSSSEVIDPGLAMHPSLAAGWRVHGIQEAMILGRKGTTYQWLVYRMAAGYYTNPIKIR